MASSKSTSDVDEVICNTSTIQSKSVQTAMTSNYHSRYLIPLLKACRAKSGKPLSSLQGRSAVRRLHHSNEADADQTHTFDLKKLGATPAVRIIIYGALGIGAVAETVFWCSCLWSGILDPNTDEHGQET